MSSFDHRKYRPFAPIRKTDRRWPDQIIDRAPRWCSVDLRDGNQALIEPMNVVQKRRMFELLVKLGFKEIEVGFPAASQPDFDFVRSLITDNVIPEDVTIQVLTQARDELIARTFESLRGARRAIVHLYNSTSTVQREQVFGLDREGIKAIAVKGARTVARLAADNPETQWVFQYSPESFTGTEMDYAVEVCNAVTAVWQPTPDNKVIINLPATVEMSTPNVFADQIEWVCDHIARRDALIISLHTHNDRGCGVAAAELGVMAGADRIEGTLLGNGERTGNMDIVTMALNLYSQGVDPQLDLVNMDEIVECVKACTQLPVHPRHPYAGELVFTAFSGSHQDAIRKCLARRQGDEPWEVAYLPIDPEDLGRDYQAVIRINSQSGKGGVAYVLEREYGIQMPRWLQIEFSARVQQATEASATELNGEQIWNIFNETYLRPADSGARILGYQLSRDNGQDSLSATIHWQGETRSVTGTGTGVVGAFVDALNREMRESVVLVEYSEHALGDTHGEGAEAISFVQMGINGSRYSGVAVSEDIVTASLNAILDALARGGSEARVAAA
ncbi:2-isopropylmalate synthase [Marinobacterium sedimentorum]|uniref:2-isopropylmalate synthase n=1 Tax=Marinobacterium sedimentorum TaxID=2927804 RepID=UPI0020C6650B|nr:2-isopropylmalate synthase [Marinobacterium sedimentorum]MCP8686177.1 2-isopropylmalate synthase [Marinobacterium sedimentorum]